jgi:protein TonB
MTPIAAPPAPPPAPDLSTPGKPKGNPGSWASPDDYPARALREERQGTTGFRVAYDASGKPTGCDVTSSSGHADLDDLTCKLIMRRARFTPGKDRAGNPTAGSYSSRVKWQIPK